MIERKRDEELDFVDKLRGLLLHSICHYKPIQVSQPMTHFSPLKLGCFRPFGEKRKKKKYFVFFVM